MCRLIQSIRMRDPAHPTSLEVVLAYPGFHAVCFHRVAHLIWKSGFKVSGRVISHISRFLTGIEIHPGAVIGDNLFIDHGMGVVIGETSRIGNNVTIYHGVSIGGRGDPLEVGKKRHPSLADNVIIGAGAQVIGNINLGEGCVVGANAVVIRDVAPHVTVAGIPAREIVHK